jgi:hypothetical protein
VGKCHFTGKAPAGIKPPKPGVVRRAVVVVAN